jgi:probable DNA metabolism protein
MMENSKILLYDGSFNGFLSCVYRSYEESCPVTDIRNCKNGQKSLFADNSLVETDIEKARRVWEAIERQQYQAAKKIYFAFLSERNGIEILLYRFICSLFHQPGGSMEDSPPSLPARIESLAALVAAEKNQMERRIRFSQEHGQPAWAAISPGYDILPLLTRYLRTRHADCDWLLYDNKRHYGFYYHRQDKKCIRLNEGEIHFLHQHASSESFINPRTYLTGSSAQTPAGVQSGTSGKLRSRIREQDSTAA